MALTPTERAELTAIFELVLQIPEYLRDEAADRLDKFLKPYPTVDALPVVKPTAYTVAREADRQNAAQDWLIAYDEVKLILDNTVKVGTTDGKTMVFNKREAAAKITQIVNDRYNAKRGA